MKIGHEIFILNRGIIKTNLLTKFHEDRTRNVAFRVFTWKTARPTGGHVFQHIIETNLLTKFHEDRKRQNVASRPNKVNCPAHWRQCIIGTNLLTKFHEDRTTNVASRVFTNQM
ncbi:hypothetical protein DPMN_160069 [Dreissena polymorpha]|uniref:Uncharacterized protein n=1 Tax=Dreissena polymorpha TaxID=45954 RepID=A0A9D4EKT9_DREPO|nr:hypothetical protein DPMN_160069 [Dreissena polymorpha]